MERKAMQKQFKLAACFFLLTVVLRGISVEACKVEDEDCSMDPCCSGLVCVTTSSGSQCEPECCEEHVDHECTLHERECCDDEVYNLLCECGDTPNDGTCKSYSKKLGEVCDPQSDVCARRGKCQDDNGTNKCKCNDLCTDDCDCCVNAVCSNGNCVCNTVENDPCDPSACVHECCELECVNTETGYKCKTV